MNVLLGHPDVTLAAEEFVRVDRQRANAQIKECCQLLAAVDNIVLGKTSMIKKNGKPYGTSHPHHPITKHMMVSGRQYRLVYECGLALARYLPAHACARSLCNWYRSDDSDIAFNPDEGDYVLCRKGLPPVFVPDLNTYSAMCRDYMHQTKGYPARYQGLSCS